eukprot:CAMPEP_0174877948 /NCGR_PEP_ID=MMETSP1114-20130205/82514_1 /TAXON_ID=312471 /ORGANISM="Neobodo designis, Strain CCAP 1951/1" /LENGTH=310 /DNA_ID=CAMNT_0016113335 /DNA_START=154 /DNA_END=1083 /DNA_ORIENTATION=+
MQMWCEAKLKASADLHNVTALYRDQERKRTEQRRVDVRLPVVWGNYAVTADVLSFLTWEEALRGVASVNRSAYEAFSTVFGGSVRDGKTVVELPRPLSLRGFRLEPLNTWQATAIVRQLVSAVHSDRTASRSAAADDDTASDYCPSEAPSSGGAGASGSRRTPEEALRGVASVNRSAYDAFSTVFGGSIRNGPSVTEQPRPLSLRGFRLEPLNAWEATAIVRQLVSAAHSDRTAPRSAAADDDAASDYCPSEAPSSVGAACSSSTYASMGLTIQRQYAAKKHALVDLEGNVLLEMSSAALSLHCIHRGVE